MYTCHHFDAIPLHEPILTHCQLNPKEKISLKFESPRNKLQMKFESRDNDFHWRKCMRKCQLNVGYFCLCLNMLSTEIHGNPAATQGLIKPEAWFDINQNVVRRSHWSYIWSRMFRIFYSLWNSADTWQVLLSNQLLNLIIIQTLTLLMLVMEYSGLGINTMPTDALAPKVARASARMVLPMWDRQDVLLFHT